MTVYTWSLNGSGSWGVASNWGPNGLPTDQDTVNIDVPGITVSVGTGVAASAYALTTQGSAVSISGGTLTTIHLATFNGAFSETSGLFMAGGMGAVFNGGVSQSAGGTLDVVNGALKLEQGGTLDGTIAGAGVLELAGGSTYFGTGFTSRVGTILVDLGAKLGFNTSFTSSQNLTIENGVVNLFGNALNLAGTTLISGTAAGGTLKETGTITLGTTNYQTTLDDGFILSLSGTAIQANQLFLGAQDLPAMINVAKGAHYNINGNWNIYNPSNVGSIVNSGVFAKTGGGKLSRVDVSLTSKGTIQTSIGQLQLNGLVNSLSGTISGNGTLGIAGGQTTFGSKLALNMAALDQSSGNLILAGPHSYAGAWDMTGGVLEFDTPKAVLTLSGRADFDGGVVTGYGGMLVLSGAAEASGNVIFGGPNTINVNGTLDQTGTITLGQSSNPVVNIASNASWLLEGDGNIQGSFGLINNAGLFSDINGSGNAVVQCELGSSGTLNVTNSTLTLAGVTSLAGSLTGSGLLELSGSAALQAGLVIKVAALDVSGGVQLLGNLSDAGVFTQYNGGVLDTGAHTLALSGGVSLDGGSLTDQGTLSTAGQTTIGYYTVTGGAELLVSGRADQVGQLTVGGGSGPGVLGIAAGGAYTVLDDFDISGGGAVVLNGVLTESGTGTSNIVEALTLSGTGQLVANDQTLTLADGGSLAGTLAGTGLIDLAVGTFSLASGLSVLSAGLGIVGSAEALLTANETYSGNFATTNGATLGLNGHTLSLTGTAALGGGTLSGPGTVLTSSSTTLGAVNVINNATLQVSGTTEQVFTMQVGDPQGMPSTASLVVGGAYTLDISASIQGDGTLTVTSAGSLNSEGNGFNQIGTSIVDSGTIAANLGTLQILGSVTGTGGFSIGAAGFLDFSSSATIGVATGVGFAGSGAILRIDDAPSFGATLQNFAAGDDIVLAQFNAASLTGTYANGAHTQILVSDGGGDSITLTFSAAQNLGALTFGAGPGGLATITHH